MTVNAIIDGAQRIFGAAEAIMSVRDQMAMMQGSKGRRSDHPTNGEQPR